MSNITPLQRLVYLPVPYRERWFSIWFTDYLNRHSQNNVATSLIVQIETPRVPPVL